MRIGGRGERRSCRMRGRKGSRKGKGEGSNFPLPLIPFDTIGRCLLCPHVNVTMVTNLIIRQDSMQYYYNVTHKLSHILFLRCHEACIRASPWDTLIFMKRNSSLESNTQVISSTRFSFIFGLPSPDMYTLQVGRKCEYIYASAQLEMNSNCLMTLSFKPISAFFTDSSLIEMYLSK